MVDATASIRSAEPKAASLKAASLTGSVTVLPAGAEPLSVYAALADDGIAAPPQTAAWIRSWIANVAPDAILATVHLAGRPVWSLALEVQKSGLARVASFMGGRHANGNFAAMDRALATISQAQILEVFDAIKRTRPDIDLLRLERLAPEIGGIRNPLLQFDHHPSPNIALAVDLDGGFDAVLERTSAKRKRKKHRSQTRKFEAVGGFRRITAATPDEVHRLLGAFLEMKEQRFAKMGIANVFGDPAVQSFFAKLFASSLGPQPGFMLHGLEVGGKLRAVTGSSVCGNRLVCEFGAIVEDELAHASPGDFLFFENIREAADRGFALYDFSVGDEPYKRLWCDTEITQYDVLVPLTLKGRAFAGTLRAVTATKTVVKNNPALWSIVKRLRRGAAKDAAPAPDAEA
jgi:CelD/BcsL family acetyltransferase involved in cellulose biosynthesis